jgi:hypothetical protein
VVLRLLVVRRGSLCSMPLLSCPYAGVDAALVGDPVACTAPCCQSPQSKAHTRPDLARISTMVLYITAPWRIS